jgi:hypothetical protein
VKIPTKKEDDDIQSVYSNNFQKIDKINFQRPGTTASISTASKKIEYQSNIRDKI